VTIKKKLVWTPEVIQAAKLPNVNDLSDESVIDYLNELPVDWVAPRTGTLAEVVTERYCFHCQNRLIYSSYICPNCGRDNFGKTKDEPSRTKIKDVR
jgi:predicted RNA-binding Zn-ribbon protein involved in translation (DUF1610 family)